MFIGRKSLVFSLLLLFASSSCERSGHAQGEQYASEVLRGAIGPQVYAEDGLCKKSLPEVSEILQANNISVSADPQSKLFYWAAIADCAYRQDNLVFYAEAIDLIILNAMEVEPSDTVSELLFSLTDNGHIGIGRSCLLFKLAEDLAENSTEKPYVRFGETRTMNRFACQNLDVNSIKRMAG